jgi:phosphoacetylglucosamine mutase
VKLVDPHGEMLHSSWEAFATTLANATTEDALLAALRQIVATAEIGLATPATVVYGHDTRPSCPSLVRALEDGLDVMGTKRLAAGLVTTPQLHYLVRCYNTAGTPEAYGEPTVVAYYSKLSTAYTTLVVSSPFHSVRFDLFVIQNLFFPQKGRHLLPALTVDCANGVGAPKLKEFAKVVTHDILPLIITRDDTTSPGALNSQCGADYVKTQQKAPPGTTLVPLQRYCSFDGDADRIVFYYADKLGTFHLLDGDKIAGLAAGFIIELVKEAGLDLNVGVVQTAYANGASTEYLTKVLVRSSCSCSPRRSCKLNNPILPTPERPRHLRPHRRQAPPPRSRILRRRRIFRSQRSRDRPLLPDGHHAHLLAHALYLHSKDLPCEPARANSSDQSNRRRRH